MTQNHLPTPSQSGEADTEPAFHLDTDGKVRYVWMRLGMAVFRERVPLHVFKMEPERKKFHLEQIADRLKRKLQKDMRRVAHEMVDRNDTNTK